MLPRFTVADRVRFMAGPSFAIKTGCEVSVEGGGETVEFGCDEADEVEVRGFDLGITGGIGVYLTPPAHRFALTVDLPYTHGMMNYLADETDDSVKHRAFGLLAGITIPLGRGRPRRHLPDRCSGRGRLRLLRASISPLPGRLAAADYHRRHDGRSPDAAHCGCAGNWRRKHRENTRTDQSSLFTHRHRL